jgi:SAM-dependent MidA family methyltransferase
MLQPVTGRPQQLPFEPPDDATVTAEFASKYLRDKGLPFRDFVRLALYDPDLGYYGAKKNAARRGADYATSVVISNAFSFAIAQLVTEFVHRTGDGLSTFVDVGCGDGLLLSSLREALSSDVRSRLALYGADQSLAHIPEERLRDAEMHFVTTIDSVPDDTPLLIFSNELFDAFPFARLVQRAESLGELWVVAREGDLDWEERPAPPEYVDYFKRRGISLAVGQYADVSLEWERFYRSMAEKVKVGMIVTFDYGFEQKKLFDIRVRRYGTAAAYLGHSVHRDLLARPGAQDLTCHINFSDLITAGEEAGLTSVGFMRQAPFLLGVGITAHPLFAFAEEQQPDDLQQAVELVDARGAARRLVLPEGIGEDVSVLVQTRRVEEAAWSFQRPLFRSEDCAVNP